jgi:hypothetical protein
MAMAGWYQAARGLGGRVRSNYRINGKRQTAEKFPPTVRKTSRRFSGLGGARITGSGASMVIEVWSHVRHATDAIDEGQRAAIDDAVQTQIHRSINFAIDSLIRKHFP